MSRRKLINLINNSKESLPDNKKFLQDVMIAIEKCNALDKRKPSKWYKPSSLSCIRNMYFTRIGESQDTAITDYKSVGMAETGTLRHEVIQNVLLRMKELGMDWEYVDVEKYVRKKQKQGKCTSLTIKGTQGAETHLIDSVLKISFRCDGIIRKISTNEYYLFEFKNQTSFKYHGKETVDEEHVDQVVCYCTALDLDKAFVLYENRDVCDLECPEIFTVTDEMKQEICVDKIMTCEQYVENLIVPPKSKNIKPSKCRWCSYKTACKKAGD